MDYLCHWLGSLCDAFRLYSEEKNEKISWSHVFRGNYVSEVIYTCGAYKLLPCISVSVYVMLAMRHFHTLEIPETEVHIAHTEYEFDEYVYGHSDTDRVKGRDSISTN